MVLVAAAAGAAMCAAYRLTDLVFDAVSKSRRQEVKESEEGEEAASRLSGEEVRKLSPVYDVKVGDRVVADVGHKRVVPGDVGRVVGLVTGKDSGEAGRARRGLRAWRGSRGAGCRAASRPSRASGTRARAGRCSPRGAGWDVLCRWKRRKGLNPESVLSFGFGPSFG